MFSLWIKPRITRHVRHSDGLVSWRGGQAADQTDVGLGSARGPRVGFGALAETFFSNFLAAKVRAAETTAPAPETGALPGMELAFYLFISVNPCLSVAKRFWFNICPNLWPRSTTKVSSVSRIAVAFIGLAALVLEAPKYLLLILSQVENRGNQNSRRFGLVEDAVWKSLHHLSSNVFKVNWCDLRKNSNAGELGVNDCDELRTEPLSIIFKSVKNFLQIGVCS